MHPQMLQFITSPTECRLLIAVSRFYHPGMQNKEIRFASRPIRLPSSDNFKLVDADTTQLTDGEVLVRTLFISVDPYLRGRMREGRSYVPPFEVGQVIESGALGEVVESRSPKL